MTLLALTCARRRVEARRTGNDDGTCAAAADAVVVVVIKRRHTRHGVTQSDVSTPVELQCVDGSTASQAAPDGSIVAVAHAAYVQYDVTRRHSAAVSPDVGAFFRPTSEPHDGHDPTPCLTQQPLLLGVKKLIRGPIVGF